MVAVRQPSATMRVECTPRKSTSPSISSVIGLPVAVDRAAIYPSAGRFPSRAGRGREAPAQLRLRGLPRLLLERAPAFELRRELVLDLFGARAIGLDGVGSLAVIVRRTHALGQGMLFALERLDLGRQALEVALLP